MGGDEVGASQELGAVHGKHHYDEMNGVRPQGHRVGLISKPGTMCAPKSIMK